MLKRFLLRHKYVVAVVLFAFLFNQLVYQLSRVFSFWRPHTDMTLALDLKIPFMPWTVAVYFACFLFWYGSYIYIARKGRPQSDRFFCAEALGKLVCFVIFIAVPTTNIRPEVTGTSLWDYWIRFVYWIDAPDNLFPSIHCMASWLIWVGVRGRRDVPVWFRWFSLFAASAICLSTLTTRQHVLLDVASAIFLAELCWALSSIPRLTALFARFADRLTVLLERLLGKEEEETKETVSSMK